ncbi:hypothetical protein Tco_0726297 [Tanacetum coccineum]|uniref:Uncharacterized protein n=1 Tax=Tanacetum coccineum TaxID=301880 RepID=A0ABQ4YG45_9ASTR
MNSYHPLLRDEQEWYLANASVTPTIEKLFFLRGPYRSDTGNQAYELHHQTYVYGYGPLYAQLARSKELESRNIPRARQVLHAVNILDWGTCNRIVSQSDSLGARAGAKQPELYLIRARSRSQPQHGVSIDIPAEEDNVKKPSDVAISMILHNTRFGGQWRPWGYSLIMVFSGGGAVKEEGEDEM